MSCEILFPFIMADVLKIEIKSFFLVELNCKALSAFRLKESDSRKKHVNAGRNEEC